MRNNNFQFSRFYFFHRLCSSIVQRSPLLPSPSPPVFFFHRHRRLFSSSIGNAFVSRRSSFLFPSPTTCLGLRKTQISQRKFISIKGIFMELFQRDFGVDLVSNIMTLIKDDDIEDCDDDDFVYTFICLLYLQFQEIQYAKEPCRTSSLKGHDYVIELLNGNDTRCFDCFRMKKVTFIAFCEELKAKTNLKASRYLTVQEQVAIFLLTISHNERNRMAAERFQHSGHTISRYFNIVLKKVCKLGLEIICPPNLDIVPMEIRSNPKYYPFFKDCIGAIDGTHIAACIPLNEQIPYRGRKATTTWNIMCVCSFDMLFTYVMSGWEGTTNDSRILLDCIGNLENKFPMPKRDQYYLVDSGYSNMPGFLAPYRGERYHLRDFRERRHHTQGKEELFNYRHSSLRNVIERCFGVLKARFPILKQMPPYPVDTQKYIPIACCTVHNFIRLHDRQDSLFNDYSNETMIVEEEHLSDNLQSSSIELDVSQHQLRRMAGVRDGIRDQLWATFRG